MDSAIKPLESERMSKYGNRYSKEFKEEAVRLLLTSGKTAEQLGRELGVTGQSLANWREEAIRNGDHPLQFSLGMNSNLMIYDGSSKAHELVAQTDFAWKLLVSCAKPNCQAITFHH